MSRFSFQSELMMHEALWELSNVSLGRRNRRLAEVTVTIPAGVTAIIGPSGAGKTSLLNLLVGFEHEDGGHVDRCFQTTEGRLPIGWVPPDFGLWPHLSVRQHLEAVMADAAKYAQSVSAEPSGNGDSQGACSPEALLEAFRMTSLADASTGRLSQGECSRLALARALMSDPEVLVLDEPLVHVDPVHLDDDWRVIRDHCTARQTSLVFSTHSPDVVLREAEHVICLDEGRVVYSGEVDALYDSPPSEQLARFLGPANWFASESADHWLKNERTSTGDACIRPERLQVEETSDSSLVIRSTQPTPTITTSLIEDEQTRELRTVYHRSIGGSVGVGKRVLLRLGAVLMMALAFAGCQQSSASPVLEVASERTLSMPVDGARIPAPRSLTVSPDGELYVLDTAGRVLVYDKAGTISRQWWMPDYDVGRPEGICVLDDGRVAVADTHYHRVVFFDRNGKVVGMFGELGEEPGQFIYPVSITRDDAGHLYVAEYGGHDRIQKFTADGKWLLTMGSFGTDAGQFQRPSGVIWHEGTLYVADAINNRVQAFDDAGTFLGVIAGWAGDGVESDGEPTDGTDGQSSTVDLEYPYDIALGSDGDLFVIEYGAGRVTSMTTGGTIIGRHGVNGRGDGQFWTPWGIAVSGDGRVFVADTGNKRIVELAL